MAIGVVWAQNPPAGAGPATAGLEPIERAIVACCASPVDARDVLDDLGVAGACQPYDAELQTLRLIPDASVRAQFRELETAGWVRLPICVAKTQYSFSDDPSLVGAPSGHVPEIRDVRLRAGAGFVVVLMGDIRTMPGLPRNPAAERIRIVSGEIDGLS